MKKAIAIVKHFNSFPVVLVFTIVQVLCAQYSETTLTGPWIVRDTNANSGAFNNLGFMVFDGKGIVEDISDFHMGCCGFIGNYTIQSQDSFSVRLYTSTCSSLFYSGQLRSKSSAIIKTGTRTIRKISNPGLLGDTLIGFFKSPLCSQKNIAICLDSDGTVISGSGIEGLSGRIFADSGLFVGHFKAIDTSTCSDSEPIWEEFSIAGALVNDSLKGSVIFGDAGKSQGTALLVRKIVSTSVNKKGRAVTVRQTEISKRQGGKVLIALEKSVSENVRVQILDLSGRAVTSTSIYPTENHTIFLDLKNLSKGAYIVRLWAQGISVQSRIAKE